MSDTIAIMSLIIVIMDMESGKGRCSFTIRDPHQFSGTFLTNEKALPACVTTRGLDHWRTKNDLIYSDKPGSTTVSAARVETSYPSLPLLFLISHMLN